MPESFNGNAGDNGENQGGTQGTSFSQPNSAADQQALESGKSGQDASNSNIDVSVLQKRVNDSQEFITTLKTERQQDQDELKRLREELEKRPSMDEIMEHINQQQGTNTNLDPDDLVNRTIAAVDQRQSAQAQAQTEQANLSEVSDKLKTMFGEAEVDAKVAEIAAESGMTFDEVFNLAKSKPKAVYKLLGIKDTAQSAPTGTSGSLNTLALGQRPVERPKGEHIMKYSTDRDRVAFFQERMKASLAELN